VGGRYDQRDQHHLPEPLDCENEVSTAVCDEDFTYARGFEYLAELHKVSLVIVTSNEYLRSRLIVKTSANRTT
jgi:hypothetical protein